MQYAQLLMWCGMKYEYYTSKGKVFKNSKTNKLKSDNVFGVLKNINFK